MAQNCYTLFKTTYNQAITDGLTTGAAQLAAQTAMNACLAAQNSRAATVAQPIIVSNGGRVTDDGPTRPKGSR